MQFAKRRKRKRRRKRKGKGKGKRKRQWRPGLEYAHSVAPSRSRLLVGPSQLGRGSHHACLKCT